MAEQEKEVNPKVAPGARDEAEDDLSALVEHLSDPDATTAIIAAIAATLDHLQGPLGTMDYVAINNIEKGRALLHIGNLCKLRAVDRLAEFAAFHESKEVRIQALVHLRDLRVFESRAISTELVEFLIYRSAHQDTKVDAMVCFCAHRQDRRWGDLVRTQPRTTLRTQETFAGTRQWLESVETVGEVPVPSFILRFIIDNPPSLDSLFRAEYVQLLGGVAVNPNFPMHDRERNADRFGALDGLKAMGNQVIEQIQTDGVPPHHSADLIRIFRLFDDFKADPEETRTLTEEERIAMQVQKYPGLNVVAERWVGEALDELFAVAEQTVDFPSLISWNKFFAMQLLPVMPHYQDALLPQIKTIINRLVNHSSIVESDRRGTQRFHQLEGILRRMKRLFESSELGEFVRKKSSELIDNYYDGWYSRQRKGWISTEKYAH